MLRSKYVFTQRHSQTPLKIVNNIVKNYVYCLHENLLLLLLESFYFCDLGDSAKFRNPMITPSGVLVTV